MKYSLPKNCFTVVHEGEVLTADADGLIDASEGAAVALLAHGVDPSSGVEAAQPRAPALPRLGDVETLSRSALAEALTALGHKAVPTSTEEMRRALRRALVTRPA